MIRLTLSLMCISGAIMLLAMTIFQNQDRLMQNYDPQLYEKKYNSSQYIIPQSKNPISDEELLSYAGYRYVMGDNPILINSDHPPLGKYIIGWFTILTGNNHLVSLAFAVLIFITVFSFIYYITSSLLLASFSLLLFSADTMLRNQIVYSPILDIIHVFFLMLYLFIFSAYVRSNKIYLLIALGLVLGSVASVKLYFPAILLLATSLIFLVITRTPIRKIIFFTLIALPLSVLTYTFTYLSYFLHGNSLRNFLGVQKWIFLFWKNNAIDTPKYYGNYIPLILFNKWKVWWGNTQFISFDYWNSMWPTLYLIGMFVTILFLFIYTLRRKTLLTRLGFLFSLWTLTCSLYLYFIPISPRYLMILYFPMYINIILYLKFRFDRYV